MLRLLEVFPARAGMSRNGNTANPERLCVPRASGDEPYKNKVRRRILQCSPRERG